MAFQVVLALGNRIALAAFFASAGVFAMAGGGAAAGEQDGSISLRLVTLDEAPRIAMEAGRQIRPFIAPFELTAGKDRAKSINLLVHGNELSELREHIKYELRRGSITAERATALNYLVDEIGLEVPENVTVTQVAVQQGSQQRSLAKLMRMQSKLNETLADTTNLVKVLGSVNSREFAGTFIAAKIQVVRLSIEKAVVDGSIAEIRQGMKRPKAG